jgi:hypothetical protein
MKRASASIPPTWLKRALHWPASDCANWRLGRAACAPAGQHTDIGTNRNVNKGVGRAMLSFVAMWYAVVR